MTISGMPEQWIWPLGNRGKLEDDRALDAAIFDTLRIAAPLGFAFVDPDLKYRRVNEPFARLHGLTPKSCCGCPVSVLSPQIAPQIAQVFQTGAPLLNVEVTEPAGDDASGEERYWQISFYPVPDRKSRRTIGLSAVALEVTEQRRAEAARAASEARTRAFVRDVLYSVSEGRLQVCETESELPDRLPAKGDSLSLESRSLFALRRDVIDAAEDAGLSSERRHDFVAAVGEAAMNAVIHGGSGDASVHSDGSRVQVWIRDFGKGISLDLLHRATLERGYTTSAILGNGFWIMLHTCDSIYLHTGSNGTIIVLEQDQAAVEPLWLRAA